MMDLADECKNMGKKYIKYTPTFLSISVLINSHENRGVCPYVISI
jgi:hypothetical protein